MGAQLTSPGGPGSASAPASGAKPGLRERKKERTREALIDAARALFARKGYEATTIDEIVAAVDVSRRTFFRYFAGKEEVALARSHAVERELVEALEERPAQEPPLVALRATYTEVLTAMAGESANSVAEFREQRQLIEDNSVLLAASLRHAIETEHAMAAIIARRQGSAGGCVDPRPALVVAIFHAVLRVAMDDWSERGDGEPDGLVREMDLAWDRTRELVGEGWAAGVWD